MEEVKPKPYCKGSQSMRAVVRRRCQLCQRYRAYYIENSLGMDDVPKTELVDRDDCFSKNYLYFKQRIWKK